MAVAQVAGSCSSPEILYVLDFLASPRRARRTLITEVATRPHYPALPGQKQWRTHAIEQ